MKKIAVIMGLAAVALFARVAVAAEITVLSAGAVQPGLTAAALEFEKQTAHTLKITYATAPQIATRIRAGEVFDVVIAPPAVLDEFNRSGRTGDLQILGRVGVGVEIREGAPVPDISSAEALKRSLLSAESLVFNRASTGAYLETLFKSMGIAEQLEGKITRYADGTAVHEHVLRGRGREIGFGAIPDILLHRDEGLRLVGPLPAEVQNYTTYAAAAMTDSPRQELGREAARYLAGAAAKALFTATGIE